MSYSSSRSGISSSRSEHVVAPTRGQVGGEAARADEVVVHPQAGDLLEEPQHLFALTPAVDHHRDGAEVHAVRRHEQQVRRHAVELGEQHPHPDGPFGDVAVDPEQLLGRHRERELVGERAEVVHAGDVGAALHERELLAGLLHPGVQVADDRLAAQDGLALEFEHEAEHAVRRRVLRTHVDDHRLIVVGVVGQVAELGGLGLAHPQHRADLAHQLAGPQSRPRLHLLRALGRLPGAVVGVRQSVRAHVSPPRTHDRRCAGAPTARVARAEIDPAVMSALP